MTPRIVITPAADRDLDDQAEYYLTGETPDTAVRWYERTVATFDFLARQPGIGSPHESRRPELADVRTWGIEGFEKHIVFYRRIPDGIEIIRIIHGARDIDRLFEIS